MLGWVNTSTLSTSTLELWDSGVRLAVLPSYSNRIQCLSNTPNINHSAMLMSTRIIRLFQQPKWGNRISTCRAEDEIALHDEHGKVAIVCQCFNEGLQVYASQCHLSSFACTAVMSTQF